MYVIFTLKSSYSLTIHLSSMFALIEIAYKLHDKSCRHSKVNHSLIFRLVGLYNAIRVFQTLSPSFPLHRGDLSPSGSLRMNSLPQALQLLINPGFTNSPAYSSATVIRQQRSTPPACIFVSVTLYAFFTSSTSKVFSVHVLLYHV